MLAPKISWCFCVAMKMMGDKEQSGKDHYFEREYEGHLFMMQVLTYKKDIGF